MEASPGEERPTDVAGRIDPTTIDEVERDLARGGGQSHRHDRFENVS